MFAKNCTLYHSSDLLPVSGLEPKLLLRVMDGVVEDRVNPFTVPFTIPPPQILVSKISTPVKAELICLNQPPPPPPLPQWSRPFSQPENESKYKCAPAFDQINWKF